MSIQIEWFQEYFRQIYYYCFLWKRHTTESIRPWFWKKNICFIIIYFLIQTVCVNARYLYEGQSKSNLNLALCVYVYIYIKEKCISSIWQCTHVLCHPSLDVCVQRQVRFLRNMTSTEQIKVDRRTARSCSFLEQRVCKSLKIFTVERRDEDTCVSRKYMNPCQIWRMSLALANLTRRTDIKLTLKRKEWSPRVTIYEVEEVLKISHGFLHHIIHSNNTSKITTTHIKDHRNNSHQRSKQ